jgi:hypothetical protein
MGANPLGDAALRNPTTGIAGCCARAASGHTAAPLAAGELARSPCDSGSITNYLMEGGVQNSEGGWPKNGDFRQGGHRAGRAY